MALRELRSIGLGGKVAYSINDKFKPVPFYCPNCKARYELARIAAPSAAHDREITCICCGGPLHGREGEFLLKYFLVERPGERKRYSSYSS